MEGGYTNHRDVSEKLLLEKFRSTENEEPTDIAGWDIVRQRVIWVFVLVLLHNRNASILAGLKE